MNALLVSTGLVAIAEIGDKTQLLALLLAARFRKPLPIILGIFGYTYGSLLGVFMVGLFTKGRGSDVGNGVAMLAGFLVVAYLSGLDIDLVRLVNPETTMKHPEWMPVIEFPWRIMFGTIVTFAVAVTFRTPDATREAHAH